MAAILIVDDEPSLRLLVRVALERAGHEVREAEDGAAALRACALAWPDVVVTDLMMPVMDGVELMRHLRAGSPPRALGIVVVSGSVGAWDVDGLADDVLTKPFDGADLAARVTALVPA